MQELQVPRPMEKTVCWIFSKRHVSGTSATVQLHGSKGNTVLNLYQGASGFSIAAGNNMYFGFSYFTDNV